MPRHCITVTQSAIFAWSAFGMMGNEALILTNANIIVHSTVKHRQHEGRVTISKKRKLHNLFPEDINNGAKY
jgi:hypothetical protein